MLNIERYLNLLNGTQYLRENLDKYIEAFVEYYGEEERERIVEKFSNATFFFTVSPENLLQIIEKASKDITEELVKDLIIKSKIELSPEEVTNNATLNFFSFSPLHELTKLYELLLAGKEKRTNDFIDRGYAFLSGIYKDLTKEQYMSLLNLKELPTWLEKIPDLLKDTLKYYLDLSNSDNDFKRIFNNCSSILKKINPNITLENCEEHIDELTNLYSLSCVMMEKFKILKEPLTIYESELEKNRTLSSSLTEIYFRKFISNNLDYVPDDELEKAKKFVDGKIDRLELGNYTKFLFKSSILSNISCFNSESESLLNNPDITEWRKDSIRKDRIKLFKMLGIDHGEKYEDYLEDEQVQEIISKHLRIADKIEEEYAKYKNEKNIELFSNYDRYKTMREEVDGLGLLDKNDGLNQSIFTLSTNTFVAPNVLIENGETKLHPLITIGADSYFNGFLDHSICHELNHLYELVLLEANENGFTYNCGWDRGSSRYDAEVLVNTIDESRDRRPYELFNEIINELISQDISKIMADKKEFVFDDHEKSRYKGYTSYEETRFLVIEFYKEFKKEIIQSRREGDYQILFDKVGQNNFEDLNNLIIDFVKNVSGFKFFSMVDSVKKGEDNELTRYYYSVVERRDNIMNNMRNYKRNVISEDDSPSIHM